MKTPEKTLTPKEKARQEGKKEGYELGYKDGYIAGQKEGFRQGEKETSPLAYSKGRLEGKRDIVTSIEIKMAQVSGYQSRQTWAREGLIPAWWIAVLIDNWEPTMREPEVLPEVAGGTVPEEIKDKEKENKMPLQSVIITDNAAEKITVKWERESLAIVLTKKTTPSREERPNRITTIILSRAEAEKLSAFLKSILFIYPIRVARR